MMRVFSAVVTLLTALFCIQEAYAQENVVLDNGVWTIVCAPDSIVSYSNKADVLSPELSGKSLGDILVNYKVEGGMWQSINSVMRKPVIDKDALSLSCTNASLGNTVVITQRLSLQGKDLVWDTTLENKSKFPVLLGDVAPAFSLQNITRRFKEPNDVFEKNFTKHQFIKGDVSYLYYTRFGGQAPYYIWTAAPGTPLEYWDSPKRTFRAYIHAGKAGGEQTRGTWRQEHTYGRLAPSGEEGDKLEYSFRLQAAGSYEELRNIIYDDGLIDVKVLPGMTVPRPQYGYFALKTKSQIDSVTAEYPSQTHIEPLGLLADDTYGYKVKFDRLGENQLTVWFGGGRKTYLDYFTILSPEDMMKARAEFLVESQQVRDSTKWFDGLYGPYDMKNGKLLTPDEPDIYDRVRTYFIASDDPALGKAPFLASKNEVFPDDEEIASIEYYIENFVWGGLQRTDEETPYPYAIYGTPNWYINRNPELKATQGNFKPGVMRAWRSFDYPHIMMMYYHMYRIAKMYPDKCHYLDAEGYLERAYQTAKAYFHYPTELHGDYYETFKWGCYNELLIPRLIEDLEEEGYQEYADDLRPFWERKAKFFIYDDKYPYHSEYIVDRTAFESSHALAEYALDYPMQPDDSLWYDNNEKVWYSHPSVTEEAARDFMERQFYANLSCRGVLESEWNTLGGDFFYSSDSSVHSYMARMGGWGVLNYALRYDDDPNDWLSLGYASYLGPYGVMNVGDEESDYGYWYPGEEKNGAIGQAMTNAKFGRPWIGTEEDRGPWRFCGEGDLGMCAITRTATSVFTCDPLFGWVFYGGNMEKVGKNQYHLYPDDGTRQDIWILSGDSRLHLKLSRDNWSKTEPIVVDLSKRTIKCAVENGVSGSHITTLEMEAIDCRPSVSADGSRLKAEQAPRDRTRYDFTVPQEGTVLNIRW